MSQTRQCAKRIEVVRRDGEHVFVDEFVTRSFGMTTQSRFTYRLGRDRCAPAPNGFVIVRTGERLRRVAGPALTAFTA